MLSDQVDESAMAWMPSVDARFLSCSDWALDNATRFGRSARMVTTATRPTHPTIVRHPARLDTRAYNNMANTGSAANTRAGTLNTTLATSNAGSAAHRHPRSPQVPCSADSASHGEIAAHTNSHVG